MSSRIFLAALGTVAVISVIVFHNCEHENESFFRPSHRRRLQPASNWDKFKRPKSSTYWQSDDDFFETNHEYEQQYPHTNTIGIKSVNATSSITHFPPEDLFDGDTKRGWISHDNSRPQSLIVVFNKKYVLSQFSVFFEDNDYGPDEFIFSVKSTDVDQKWVTLKHGWMKEELNCSPYRWCIVPLNFSYHANAANLTIVTNWHYNIKPQVRIREMKFTECADCIITAAQGSLVTQAAEILAKENSPDTDHGPLMPEFMRKDMEKFELLQGKSKKQAMALVDSVQKPGSTYNAAAAGGASLSQLLGLSSSAAATAPTGATQKAIAALPPNVATALDPLSAMLGLGLPQSKTPLAAPAAAVPDSLATAPLSTAVPAPYIPAMPVARPGSIVINGQVMSRGMAIQLLLGSTGIPPAAPPAAIPAPVAAAAAAAPVSYAASQLLAAAAAPSPPGSGLFTANGYSTAVATAPTPALAAAILPVTASPGASGNVVYAAGQYGPGDAQSSSTCFLLVGRDPSDLILSNDRLVGASGNTDMDPATSSIGDSVLTSHGQVRVFDGKMYVPLSRVHAVKPRETAVACIVANAGFMWLYLDGQVQIMARVTPAWSLKNIQFGPVGRGAGTVVSVPHVWTRALEASEVASESVALLTKHKTYSDIMQSLSQH